MKSFFLIITSIISITSFGQNQYSLGEKDFTQDKEEATVFTSFTEKNLPKPPDSIDLFSMMPPTGDQGKKGSCWAWATTYVLRSVMDHPNYYENNNTINYSQVYSPEYVYQLYKGNIKDCNWGAYSFEMLEKILNDGVVKFSDFSYDQYACNIQPNNSLKVKAKQFAKPGYVVVKLDDLFSIQHVLSTQHQPLLLSIKIDDFFKTKGNINKKSPFWNTFNTRKGSHAMVVVGYNNRLKALKVLNSWGTDFGDNGYVWISYSIINSAMNYCCYPTKDNSKSVDRVAVEGQQTDNSTVWPSGIKKISSWFKRGYYRIFDQLRIGLAGLNKEKEFALIEIRDSTGILKNNFYIEAKTKKEFYVNGKKYVFTFDNIGDAGYNPFKKALYFTIEQNNIQN